MKNGTCWLDTEGKLIQAHGGVIIEYQNRFYWYGENKDADTHLNRVPFLGFSCYSSKDMVNWSNEGVVLKSVNDDPEHELSSTKVGERPKVVYNKMMNRFVMWFHLDDATYNYARIGIADADVPTGPFTYRGSLRPDSQGKDSRDMTLYQDDDDSVYLFCSTNWNATTLICQLSEDNLSLTGESKLSLIEQYREAPVIIKENNIYYSFTSGCTGWDPNAMLYGCAREVMGTWRLIDNPCTGMNYRKTYNGQTSNAFKVNGQWYLMLDHWNKDDLRSSGYSFLPVHINGYEVEIPWKEEFLGIKDTTD
ncbi:family 43 glycosylhydrolase [Paenibacillus sp. LMG 31461]|uniref:Family 43 glycosylhydrolase n=1 Tax=Paenibacillus plantarum TaxID=2654975 RepID=A0ABX1X415_9BACL|nr:glycoside hydrolase family 43 protein [Paenibacillus plantarum]NOU62839.1 family 43 glycosylhydrolase [Paenibacillus plantarum]